MGAVFFHSSEGELFTASLGSLRSSEGELKLDNFDYSVRLVPVDRDASQDSLAYRSDKTYMPYFFEVKKCRGKKKEPNMGLTLLSSRKEIRHRTTLPQSNMQYHRRWAPYRSCSGWERELQARHGHRKKRIKDARFMLGMRFRQTSNDNE